MKGMTEEEGRIGWINRVFQRDRYNKKNSSQDELNFSLRDLPLEGAASSLSSPH